MKGKIISIGFGIPGLDRCNYSYNSSQSLLDADVIVFEPDFSCYTEHHFHKGKKSFENDSFRLKKDTERWRSEISVALREGKTVFVFMGKYEEFYIRTGQRKRSGTGKNMKTLNTVSKYNNYEFLPVKIPPLTSAKGSELKFSGNDLFAGFWKGFRGYIKYECYFNHQEGIDELLFFTKTGRFPVGGIFRKEEGKLVLLPPIRYPVIEYTEWSPKAEVSWAKESEFGERLVRALLDIDTALRTGTFQPPAWIDNYRLKSETELMEKINSASKDIEKLQEKKDALSDRLQEERKLKNLLFETGKPLEDAVIEALEILGYEVEDYRDGALQIDQVISDPDGTRYIGETKGKNDAIKIGAFRQLLDNIQGDFERKDITNHAVGILFGNGFRNTHPHERGKQFTDKCITRAKQTEYILVRTSDLFEVASYVRESNDKEFAEKCRTAILKSRGKIVKFPEVATDVS